jgi:uridine kinase
MEERTEHNFDHPDSLDTDRLYEDILKLKVGHDHNALGRAWVRVSVLTRTFQQAGKAVDIPTYDFTTHSRTDVTERIEAKRIILLEGILIFTHEKLRDLIDIRIFVDTADDMRFIRRLTRDMNERGRTTHSVIKQYMKTVSQSRVEVVSSL